MEGAMLPLRRLFDSSTLDANTFTDCSSSIFTRPSRRSTNSVKGTQHRRTTEDTQRQSISLDEPSFTGGSPGWTMTPTRNFCGKSQQALTGKMLVLCVGYPMPVPRKANDRVQ